MSNISYNERLANLLRFDARAILSNVELKAEYIALHKIEEGFEPACTGCSAKLMLNKWKRKVANKKRITKKIEVMSNNTFTLKKSHPRLSIPFTSGVITKDSTDELVWFYLNQSKTEDERKRREAFFDVLPEVKKPKRKRAAKKAVKKVEDKKVDVSDVDFTE